MNGSVLMVAIVTMLPGPASAGYSSLRNQSVPILLS